MHQDVNSNSRGSLLPKMEVETDSDVPEFSLPPKSIVKRTKKTIRKRTRSRWRKYCKTCCRYCSGVLLALVLCACVLSIALLFWFSLRLYRDVENLNRRLTIEINRVQTEQVTNVEKCTSLEIKMKENMKVLENGQKDILDYKRQLQMSYAKIAVLNGTLLKMSRILHSPKSQMSLSNTVNALKKGMADTGAEMTKLSDEIKQIGEATLSQSRAIRRILFGLFNISSELANITGKSPKMFHSGTEDYLQQKLQDESDSNEDNSNGSLLKLDVYDVIDTLNNSLSAQVKHLQSETEILKMKSGLPSSNGKDSVNIYNEIYRVQRDMSGIQQLIKKLNTQVGNLTQPNTNSYENSHQIRLLWQEVEWQNESIFQIQQIINQNMEYKSGIPFRRGTDTGQDSSMEDDFEIFPEETDPIPKEQRRDTLRTRFKNLKSNSDRKYSRKFGDLIDDNIT